MTQGLRSQTGPRAGQQGHRQDLAVLALVPEDGAKVLTKWRL